MYYEQLFYNSESIIFDFPRSSITMRYDSYLVIITKIILLVFPMRVVDSYQHTLSLHLSRHDSADYRRLAFPRTRSM